MGKVPGARSGTKRIARGKGVHRDVELEGKPRQTTDLTHSSCIGRSMVGKSAE